MTTVINMGLSMVKQWLSTGLVISFLLSDVLTSSAQPAASEGKVLAYQFDWDGTSTILKVDLKYSAAAKDSSTFIFGNAELGGQKNIFDILKNIHPGPGDSLSVDVKTRKIKIYHLTEGTKSLHYEIDASLVIDALRARPNELFRPVISDGTFYSLGYNLFLKPVDSTYQSATLIWRSWPERTQYFNSLAPEAQPGEIQHFSIEAMNNLLLVMDDLLIRKQYCIYGVPYYAITSRRDTVNNMQQELTPFFTKFFPMTRDFWEDRTGDYYFICMLPLFNNVSSTATGVNLGQGFIMKYSGAYDDMKKRVIAHETSHTWIGKALRIKSEGFRTTWFSEGFNDYISIYILARTGMLDKSSFLKHLNEDNLRPHYTNPVNTAPADSIEKNFWTNHNYEVLSYQRGFIYAFYLDNQIRLYSGGRQNIRDFLLTFFRNTRNMNRSITLEDYLKNGAKFLPGDQILKETNMYLLQGALLDFTKIRLTKAFSVSFEKEVPLISIFQRTTLSDIYTW